MKNKEKFISLSKVKKLCRKAMQMGESNGLDDSHGTAQSLDKIFTSFLEQNGLKKVKKAKKKISKSLDGIRLEKAKKLYPVGTEFTSLWGARDVVTESNGVYNFGGGSRDVHYIGDNHTIMVRGKREDRMIYDGGNWARIIK